MKIVLLSDIHGNLPALERVLELATALNPDKVVVLGDSIGYFYDSSAVIDLLRSHADIVVRGNHERAYVDILEGRDDGTEYRAKYGSALARAVETLTSEQNAWIASLKDHEIVEIGGKTLHFTHEAPNTDDGYLYPDATESKIISVASDNCDAIIFGHSHYPFSVMRQNCQLINPGSVGQARDIGGLAQWAVVHVETMVVEMKRTPYETESVEAAAQRHDPLLPYLTQVLRRGKISEK